MGHSLHFFFLSSLLITFYSPSTWAAEDKVEDNSLESLLQAQELKLDQAILKTSYTIYRLQKNIEKNNLPMNWLDKAIKQAKANEHFSIFAPHYVTLKTLAELKSRKAVIGKCNALFETTPTTPLDLQLHSQNQSYCRNKLSSFVIERLRKKKSLQKPLKSFISGQLFWLYESPHRDDLEEMITLSKRHKPNYSFFSEEIANFLFQHQKAPSRFIVDNLFIGPKMTAIIQRKGIVDEHRETSAAKKVYDRFIKTFYDEAEKENFDKKKIKKIFSQLQKHYFLNKDELPRPRSDERLLTVTGSMTRRGLEEHARPVLEKLCREDKGRTQDFYHDCLFAHLWTYLRNEEYEAAKKWLDESENLAASSKDQRFMFWEAYTRWKRKESESAISFFKETISKNPLSYYAILSAKKLQLIDKEKFKIQRLFEQAIAPTKEKTLLQKKHLTPSVNSSLVRLKAWGHHGLAPFIETELKTLETTMLIAVAEDNIPFKEIRSELKLLAAKALSESQNFLSSFKLLYAGLGEDAVELDHAVLETLFPTPFLDNIQSVEKEIDPLIFLSLIRQESAFNPAARSIVGARGLMQLMPKTARMVRRRYVSARSLANPRLNIKLGTKYFKYLLKRHDNNLVYSLAAYNAGEHRVRRWQKRYFKQDSMLHTVEEIPFNETQKYVKLIYRNLFFYKLLLDQEIPINLDDPNKLFDALGGAAKKQSGQLFVEGKVNQS